LETDCCREKLINWVTREDTCSTNKSRSEQSRAEQRGDPSDIIKGANLKGAIRNRKLQKKAPKKKDLSTLPSSHTQKKQRGFKRTRLPDTHSLTPVGFEKGRNHY
jgi:hypothetical protein